MNSTHKARRIVLYWLPLAFTLAVSAHADDAVIASMGKIEVKSSDVTDLLDIQGAPAGSSLSAKDIDQLIRTEAMRQALIVEASAKGWDKREEVIALMEIAKDQVLVQSYLNDIARPAADYPGDSEIKKAYDENQSSFKAPRQFRMSQIYLSLNADSKPQDIADKAENVAAEAQKKGADFAKLATENSQHASSVKKGGDMGWLAEDQISPEIRTAVSALDKGQVSKPVKTEQGWHIIKLTDEKAAGIMSLSDAREQIKRALRLQKAQANERKYLEGIITKTPLKVNEVEVARLQDSLRGK